MALLEVEDLDGFYGDFQALFGITMTVDEGQAVAVIGANGAGKSTLMKTIAGLVDVGGGELHFEGRSLRGVSAHARVAMGISLVPEGRRIFRSLSVEENVEIGGYRNRPGPWTKVTVYETFPLLGRLAKRSAARLSGGEQQALAIGRALMSNPRLLLLDEVSLGLAPVVVKQLYEALPLVQAQGTTAVIVEQDINRALGAADYAYCLLEGRISLKGQPRELGREAVTAAYFGLPARAVPSVPSSSRDVSGSPNPGGARPP